MLGPSGDPSFEARGRNIEDYVFLIVIGQDTFTNSVGEEADTFPPSLSAD